LALFIEACIPTSLKLDSGPMLVPITQAGYHWTPDRFPIPVYVHPQMDPIRKLAVLLAIDQWNESVGGDVFEYIDAPPNWPMFEENGAFTALGFVSVEEGLVGVDPDMNVQRNAWAAVSLRPGRYELLGEIHGARVMIGTHVSGLEDAARITFHELGHCLGLAHDGNDRTSIMYYSATLSMSQHLQEEDLAYVRQQVGTWTAVEVFRESLQL